jgi:hypothetical protein
MDIVERLRKSANTIYSQDGYTFRLGLHNEAADEIDRLRETLRLIAEHPVKQSQQWETAAKEMIRLAVAATKDDE